MEPLFLLVLCNLTGQPLQGMEVWASLDQPLGFSDVNGLVRVDNLAQNVQNVYIFSYDFPEYYVEKVNLSSSDIVRLGSVPCYLLNGTCIDDSTYSLKVCVTGKRLTGKWIGASESVVLSLFRVVGTEYEEVDKKNVYLGECITFDNLSCGTYEVYGFGGTQPSDVQMFYPSSERRIALMGPFGHGGGAQVFYLNSVDPVDTGNLTIFYPDNSSTHSEARNSTADKSCVRYRMYDRYDKHVVSSGEFCTPPGYYLLIVNESGYLYHVQPMVIFGDTELDIPLTPAYLLMVKCTQDFTVNNKTFYCNKKFSIGKKSYTYPSVRWVALAEPPGSTVYFNYKGRFLNYTLPKTSPKTLDENEMPVVIHLSLDSLSNALSDEKERASNIVSTESGEPGELGEPAPVEPTKNEHNINLCFSIVVFMMSLLVFLMIIKRW